jgi:hypothetical protein
LAMKLLEDMKDKLGGENPVLGMVEACDKVLDRQQPGDHDQLSPLQHPTLSSHTDTP